ncbi:hypothetical protein CIG75_07150 [Tumebacillus algifaecis]|uniref:Lipoprotein n=1 Tax=Tumebacillus algifaecis TaxID=1214604 RepID=A0A223D058_9BACL|nr:hypothetical protein [Tumebacillus algifaecis]ASS74774.1 hypothetical protein CIG75_07150 [Tumebacillus algifaecis]
MRKAVLMLAITAMLLVGCAPKADQQKPSGQTAPPQSNNGGTGSDTPKPSDGTKLPTPTAEKTDEQIKTEIRAKLQRLTTAQSGYSLPVNDKQVVQQVSSLQDVTESLRKKGYSQPLAKTLTEEFYQERITGGTAQIILLARGGHMGRFSTDAEATFTKKSKWVWLIEQEHPDDNLHGPHTSTYEVEVLKDGTYRLNSWTNRKL